MTRLTARQQLDRTILERDWLRDVVQLAHLNGWLVTHFGTALSPDGHWLTAISGDKGFPDLVMVRDEHIIFVELKSELGRLTPEQERWFDALAFVAGASDFEGPQIAAYIWRPSDREEVARILARRVV